MKITYMSFENISLEIITENDKLKGINFVESFKETTKDDSFQKEIKKELMEYFEGKRKVFEIPLEVEGTEFQKKVWTEMAKIPFGERMSYGELAEKSGCPKGARAVGLACNKNKIPIIIPCHRVVGKNGNLTGFAGGLDMKAQLLKLEN
jgi:methylated-DNA-[protein]-cysteine S-methyltransferase